MRRLHSMVCFAAVVVIALGSAVSAVATTAAPPAIGGSHTYAGPDYGEGTPVPTADRPQSKLWFHDGAWWALLISAEDEALHVAELMPDHTWRMTATVVNATPGIDGDALPFGDTVYVAGRQAGDRLTVSRLTYRPDAREYVQDQGFPTTVRVGHVDAPTIARDSTGRLWMAFTSATNVGVVYSDDDGVTWSDVVQLPHEAAEVERSDLAGVVAFDTSVGVLWSDEVDGAFHFAVHEDGDGVDDWTLETPVQGPAMSDDHLNVKVYPGEPDTVVAVVKTSLGDAGEPDDSPLLLLLKRTGDGAWTQHTVATVADDHSRAALMVDTTHEAVHVLAHAPVVGGAVYLKSASLAAPVFPPGRGTPFIQSGNDVLRDVAGTKMPVDARTGLVALAVDERQHRYVHGEVALPLPDGGTMPQAVGDDEPPLPPQGVLARATPDGAVVVRWSPAVDAASWWPGAVGMPVSEYQVLRDGTPVGTTRQTEFNDDATAPERSYEYQVVALDHAGNVSPPSESVVVALPEAQSDVEGLLTNPLVVSLSAVVLIGLAAVALTRSLKTRRELRTEV